MIQEITERSLDGVPLLQSERLTGRIVAVLMFRVGRFDEPLPLSGITHLAEHLVFAGRPRPAYHFNASVGGLYTTFYMDSADPADVPDFVQAVCAGLVADASAELERERMVLRTEAASRGGTGALARCLAERYGAVGPGILNYREFGLHHVRWTDIDAWRRRSFTAGNAVLLVAGEVPEMLEVTLPDGPAMRPAQVSQLGLPLPGFTVGGHGRIGLSMVARHKVASFVTAMILRERLTQVLRHEQGLTYSVQEAVEQLDADHAHTWITADALPEQQAVAAHAMLSTFEALIDSGCDASEIDSCVRKMTEALADPAFLLNRLVRHARSILAGTPVRAPEESVRLAAELTPAVVSQAAQELYDQLIVATPAVIPAVQGRMQALPGWSAESVTGQRHESVDADATPTPAPAVTRTAKRRAARRRARWGLWGIRVVSLGVIALGVTLTAQDPQGDGPVLIGVAAVWLISLESRLAQARHRAKTRAAP